MFWDRVVFFCWLVGMVLFGERIICFYIRGKCRVLWLCHNIGNDVDELF